MKATTGAWEVRLSPLGKVDTEVGGTKIGSLLVAGAAVEAEGGKTTAAGTIGGEGTGSDMTELENFFNTFSNSISRDRLRSGEAMSKALKDE